MTWTAPMTAVSNSLLTASQFNVHVRNNLLETEAARATTPVSGTGKVWFADGPNRSSEHQIKSAIVDDAETTIQTEYSDLDTPGPWVALKSGCGFMIFMQAQMGISLSPYNANASYTIYKSDTRGEKPDESEGGFENPANTSRALQRDGANGNNSHNRFGVVQVWATVPEYDLYAVRMVYKTSNAEAVATFQKRRITVMAI